MVSHNIISALYTLKFLPNATATNVRKRLKKSFYVSRFILVPLEKFMTRKSSLNV